MILLNSHNKLDRRHEGIIGSNLCYNEEENIAPLSRQIMEALEGFDTKQFL